MRCALFNLLCLKDVDVDDWESTAITDADNNGDDTARQDDSVEHVQKPTESDPSTSSTVTKKKSKTAVYVPKDVKALTDMAAKATEVLSNMSAKKSNAMDSPTVDKDWDFCKFLYHKLKEIPDGDLKDDLQLEIQRMVYNTKRQIIRQQTCASYTACQMGQQQTYHHAEASKSSTEVHAMTTANQSMSFLQALGAVHEPPFPTGFTSNTFTNL